jgi:DNA polymerase-2
LTEQTSVDGFLLSRQWRDLSAHDTESGVELSFWLATADGPIRLCVPAQKSVCFVDRESTLQSAAVERRQLSLSTLEGKPVDALYFNSQRAMGEFHQQSGASGGVYESDIKPADRYLMERFVCAGMRATGELIDHGTYRQIYNPSIKPCDYLPALRLASIDIETRGLSSQLYSIAIHSGDTAVVLMISEGEAPAVDGFELRYFDSERRLLENFFQTLHALDPDILIGWNVVNFDLDFLYRKCQQLGLSFAFGRGTDESIVLQPGAGQVRIARTPGRAVLDGVDMLRAAFWSFESFSLQYVSQELLGRGKTITSPNRVDEINELYRTDKPALARYNIEDCRLVTEIFDKADLISFAMQRAQMTGLPIDKYGGAVQTFDNLYLPRLHRKGYVAPAHHESTGRNSPGGYVLDSIPGIYKNVIVLDFKSLYPSIIRTFLIDPLGLALGLSQKDLSQNNDVVVPGFEGAVFARDKHILPGLVEDLWAKRDEAKAQGNSALSQAIKIIMNSLYGVLGSNGCRFHHHQLASSITRRGHEIILASQALIEDQGYRVIYGDTDSLFVLIGGAFDESQIDGIGNQLQEALNQHWQSVLKREYQLQSCLEVEFETHYLRFVMPTIRGTESGSKKRYAGLVRQPDGQTSVVFKGLEAVRTDWTPMAREFQRRLYEKVFNDEPVDELIKQMASDLWAGKLDSELVYRKRLRRKLSDYKKNIPPHVQAARKQSRPGGWVSYVITVNGPEPSDERVSALDYQHYADKQLMPVADGILHFFETSYSSITSAQFEMF